MKSVPAELQEWERKNTCKKNWRDFHAGLNLKQEGFLVLFCFVFIMVLVHQVSMSNPEKVIKAGK